MWTKNRDAEKMADISHYMADPDIRRQAWRHRIESGMEGRAQRHRALADLERRGSSTRSSRRTSTAPPGCRTRRGRSRVHGTVHEVKCTLRRFSPMEPTLDRAAAGDDDPACPGCGGIPVGHDLLRREPVPEVLQRSQDAAGSADLVLRRSSLTVYPAAGLRSSTGSQLVVVNARRVHTVRRSGHRRVPIRSATSSWRIIESL
ncbi:MAG: hypothetical protein R3A49_08955 [Acidimicrobiia bacterium]